MKHENKWVSIAERRRDRKSNLSSVRLVDVSTRGIDKIKRDCRVGRLEKEGIIW